MTDHAAATGGQDAAVRTLWRAFAEIVAQLGEDAARSGRAVPARTAVLCDGTGAAFAQDRDGADGVAAAARPGAGPAIARFGATAAPGDVYVTNDPYRTSTHPGDVTVVRPVVRDGVLVAAVQTTGRWPDLGGSVPGSVDPDLRERYGGALHLDPVRVWDGDTFRHDVVDLVAANVRDPEDARRDLVAQAEATARAERALHALCDRHGTDAVRGAIAARQDETERLVRGRIAALPDGTWRATAEDEAGTGAVAMTLRIDGDRIAYDLSGSSPAVAGPGNATAGAAGAAAVAATVAFLPGIPLDAGLYRAVDVDPGPPGSVVHATDPAAVVGMDGPCAAVARAVDALWRQEAGR